MANNGLYSDCAYGTRDACVDMDARINLAGLENKCNGPLSLGWTGARQAAWFAASNAPRDINTQTRQAWPSPPKRGAQNKQCPCGRLGNDHNQSRKMPLPDQEIRPVNVVVRVRIGAQDAQRSKLICPHIQIAAVHRLISIEVTLKRWIKRYKQLWSQR